MTFIEINLNAEGKELKDLSKIYVKYDMIDDYEKISWENQINVKSLSGNIFCITKHIVEYKVFILNGTHRECIKD